MASRLGIVGIGEGKKQFTGKGGPGEYPIRGKDWSACGHHWS